VFKKNCSVCSSPFETNRFAQVTCSEQCRREYRRHFNRDYHRQYYQKNPNMRKQFLLNKKINYNKNREQLFNSIGSKCVICGSQKRLSFHEIFGKNHIRLDVQKGFDYILTHSEDFIALCSFHHKFVHQFAKCGEWNKFKELVEKLRLLNHIENST